MYLLQLLSRNLQVRSSLLQLCLLRLRRLDNVLNRGHGAYKLNPRSVSETRGSYAERSPTGQVVYVVSLRVSLEHPLAPLEHFAFSFKLFRTRERCVGLLEYRDQLVFLFDVLLHRVDLACFRR